MSVLTNYKVRVLSHAESCHRDLGIDTDTQQHHVSFDLLVFDREHAHIRVVVECSRLSLMSSHGFFSRRILDSITRHIVYSVGL